MQLANSIANNRFWNKHGVSITWGLAGLCLLLSVIYIGWTTYSQAQTRAANLQPQDIRPLAQPSRRLYQVAEITSANLFGDPTPRPVVTNAPKTTLNLTLQGVLSASDQSMARAIITSGKSKTELYSVGENIQGAGASIKEIRATEVLLNRNGATESLPMVKSDLNKNNPIISYADVNAANSRQAALDNLNSGSNRPAVSRERFAAANVNTNRQRQGTNGTPRKVRKPNFSGLDRALKKMGEL